MQKSILIIIFHCKFFDKSFKLLCINNLTNLKLCQLFNALFS